MFHNQRNYIFIYYILTVSTFLGILYYFINIIQIQNIFFLALILSSFIILAGIMISKLAISPLKDHITSLQNLSKETLHELNLPISTITTNLDMLKKNEKNEKNLKRLSRIENACNMLRQRYNELDYMIKMQSASEIKENFSLDNLLKNRIEFFKNIYPHMQFNLELQNTNIINDKIGLSKVIDNIIDNGVKYSQNSTKCDIKLINNTIYIQDYGCGIDEVELVKIFDNYYQTNSDIQGFGIGLSMVKRFCDTHNIKLSFKSKLGFGTTVSLKFKEN